MSARDAEIDAKNLARIQEIADLLSARGIKPIVAIGFSISMLVAASFLWGTPLYVPAIMASFASLGWFLYLIKKLSAPPERVFEILAAFEPLTEASRHELAVLQVRLKQGSARGDSFEIKRWYTRELGLSVEEKGNVRAHFRDVFFSKELGRQYWPAKRQALDECQVLPVLKEQTK